MMMTNGRHFLTLCLLAVSESFTVLPSVRGSTLLHQQHQQNVQKDQRQRIYPSGSSCSITQLLSSSLGASDPLGPPTLSSSSNVLVGSEKTRKKNLKQFSRYLEVECWKQRELRDLEPVLLAVSDACKQITRIVQRAQTDDLYGVAVDANGKPLEETNIQGEVQQKLDVVCNTIMLRAFCACSNAICTIASEEEDKLRSCAEVLGNYNDRSSNIDSDDLLMKKANSIGIDGRYVAVFDPLDGSKNIDASLPVGSIFGIYEKSLYEGMSKNNGEEGVALPQGCGLVAAGYCLFSATTVLVVTLGSGVDGFTLDPDKGAFLHTHPDIRIPSDGPIYSFNEANFRDFDEPIRTFLDALKNGDNPRRTRCQARYVGALVADAHNILINGGIYGYPATRVNPNGKLRLLYECNPMAMIMEQAGGAASTGTGRILDEKCTEAHQRVPTFLGSIENVFELDRFVETYSD